MSGRGWHDQIGDYEITRDVNMLIAWHVVQRYMWCIDSVMHTCVHMLCVLFRVCCASLLCCVRTLVDDMSDTRMRVSYRNTWDIPCWMQMCCVLLCAETRGALADEM